MGYAVVSIKGWPMLLRDEEVEQIEGAYTVLGVAEDPLELIPTLDAAVSSARREARRDARGAGQVLEALDGPHDDADGVPPKSGGNGNGRW